MQSGSGILQVSDLSLNIDGAQILNSLSLSVKSGEVQAVIGPNGSGKSSLASTIMGLEGYNPDRGEIYFEGEAITDLDTHLRAQRGLALAWQHPARYEGVSVGKFLALGLKGRGLEINEEKIRWALEEVAINPDQYLDRDIDETLSGGERKRIELASILLMEPKVVILDEPDSGVDVIALNNINKVISDFREQGTAVVLITHSEEMLDLADSAALLCEGEIIRKGDPGKIADYFKDDCDPCGDREECQVEVKESA